ncbi:MAG: HAD-IIIA family hydrolase [Candidatus Omnitrophica bacterium]|nr:HAD-IIIA family hydrolase [Candidatus Omnitrophota bacterium]
MKKVRVVFLDRDGVINEYPGKYKYVTSIEDFRLLPKAREALSRLVQADFRLFVISNQAGVAKGLYSQRTLDSITQAMLSRLGPDIRFENIFYCTHLPDAQCSCRKPGTAFIDAAEAQLNAHGMRIDRPKSYFVGDSIRDIETGRKAGVRTILVFSGSEHPDNEREWQVRPDACAAGISEAVDRILS